MRLKAVSAAGDFPPGLTLVNTAKWGLIRVKAQAPERTETRPGP